MFCAETGACGHGRGTRRVRKVLLRATP